MDNTTSNSLQTQINDSLSGQQSQILLLNIPIENAFQTNLEIVRILQLSGLNGLYISLVTNTAQLIDTFKENQVDISRIVFIDGISRLYGHKEIENGKVIFVPGPLSLDQITSESEKILHGGEGQRHFVILDCITGLLLYNNLDKTISFLQNINRLIRENNGVGVLIVYNKDKTIETLSGILSQDTKIINL